MPRARWLSGPVEVLGVRRSPQSRLFILVLVDRRRSSALAAGAAGSPRWAAASGPSVQNRHARRGVRHLDAGAWTGSRSSSAPAWPGVAGVALTLLGSIGAEPGHQLHHRRLPGRRRRRHRPDQGRGDRGLRARHAAGLRRVLDHGLSIAKVVVFVVIVAFLQVRPQGLVTSPDEEPGMSAGYRRGTPPCTECRVARRPGSVNAGGPWSAASRSPRLLLFAVAPACCRRSGSTCWPSTSASPWSPSASAWPGAAAACSTLGQGVFFGLGGYAMAMHLKLADAGPGGCPTSWRCTAVGRRCRVVGAVPPARGSRCLAILAAARCWSPACSASLVFRRRVRGAYFAILSQALAAALRDPAGRPAGHHRRHQRPHRLPGFFGYDLDDPVNKRMLSSSPPACCSRWSRWPAS